MTKMTMRVSLLGMAMVFLAACSSGFESEYVQGCVSSGVPKDMCKCAYKNILKKYPEEKLEEFNRHPERIPDSFMEYAMKSQMACMVR